jgi:hypothetical protein
MKQSRITFLFMLLLLFVPSVSYGRTAGEGSWGTFWAQFTTAIKSRNKASIKRLMVPEKNFLDGGSGYSRDTWLDSLTNNLWHDLQRSIAAGTVPYKEINFRGRVTKDRTLIFQNIGGRWYFAGLMGD